jgi:serine/threonine protein kinase
VNTPCGICDTYIAFELEDRGTSMVCGQCGGVTEIPTDRVFSRALIGGDFIVESEIAAGGMGTVYRAHQISLDITVALKVLHTEFSNDPNFIQGFIKEARNAAQLNHPNIMFVNAVGKDLDVFYIAMEFIDGLTVTEMMGTGAMDVDESINIILKVATGLDYAWNEKQIVHRDLKPDNIMTRAEDGEVKLADLGLASPAGDIDYDDDEINATPQYMCPEVMTFGVIDNRSDIYSLGATWYHMITGCFPFERDDALQMAQAHVNEPLVPAHELNDQIPQQISSIICKMMEKAHEDRYQTYQELIDDLKGYQRAERRRRKRASQPGRPANRRKMSASRTGIPPTTTPEPPKKSNLPLIVIMGGVALIIVGVVLSVLLSEPPAPQPPPRAKTTPAKPATPQKDETQAERDARLAAAFGRTTTDASQSGGAGKVAQDAKSITKLWRHGGSCKLIQSDDRLIAESTGTDPQLLASIKNAKKGGPFKVSLRMKSSATGQGTLYFNNPASEDRAVMFDVKHDSNWHEYTVDVPATNLHGLRLDPADSKGRIEIDWVTVHAKDGEHVITWASKAARSGTAAPATAGAGSAMPGRYVRIELPGDKRVLSLSEVEVFVGGTNVALGKSTKQSSTNHGGAARRAVDGKTSPQYESGTVTHTNEESAPWWEVDLGKPHDITQIVVWNRGQKYFGRLHGFKVSILDNQRAELWQASVKTATVEEMSFDIARPPTAEGLVQGLRGEYFDNRDWKGDPVLVRIDPAIEFDWRLGGPASEVPRDEFSVRWTGFLKPARTGTYRISGQADDKVQILIDGTPNENNSPRQLQAGRLYKLEVRYFEGNGGAAVNLSWSDGNSSPGQIPATVMFCQPK